MTKTTSKTTGNRFKKWSSTYLNTTPFFNPDGELEDGEVKATAKSSPTVKIPVKIEASGGGDSRTNMFSFEMKSITHFDNNV